MSIYRGTGSASTTTDQATIDEVTTQATNAANSATSAASSASSAASSASSASSSASTATSQASAASTSATNAASSASAASTSASNAATSATNAATSATTAASEATNAETAETGAVAARAAAESAQTAAETAKDLAEGFKDLAASSASSASSSASTATTKASEASASATAAGNAQTAAEAAQAAAEAAQAAIDGTYLGALASNPTGDGNGDDVTVGDWYFNTASNQAYIYNGSTWDALAPDLIGDATPQLGGNLDTNGNDITFGDNDKAIFGAGSDLQIYHDGSNSRIGDVGAGNLWIYGDGDVQILNQALNEYKARFITDGAVELYYNGNQKLATTISGIDVTGTVTADGLTVVKDSATSTIGSDLINFGGTDYYSAEIELKDTGNRTLVLRSPSGIANARIGTTTNHQFEVITSDTLRASIGTGGDISFYEDTGTTAKFFWDASDEELKLTTTSSNSNALSVSDGTYGVDLGTSSTGGIIGTYNANQTLDITTYGTGVLKFNTAATERMRLDANGNVGVNVTPPSDMYSGVKTIQLGHEGGGIFTANTIANGTVSIGLNNYFNSSLQSVYATSNPASQYAQVGGEHRWRTAPSGTAGGVATFTQAMTLDASGNLLVGHTSLNATSGVDIGESGYIRASRYADECLLLNREFNDGKIAVFSKDGATVGSIGSRSGGSGESYIVLNANSPGAGLVGGGSGDALLPSNSSGAPTDASTNLGNGSFRFKDLYLSNNVLVGATSNTGSGATSGTAVIQFNGAVANGIYVDDTRTASGTDNALVFGRGATFVGKISTTTSSTSYVTSSDYRLKENVVDMTGAVDRVKALNPSQFNFIADPDTTVDGFLAHEVADVVPEAVTGTKDAMQTEEYEVTPAVLDDDGNVVTEAVMGTREVPDYQGIDQSKLVPLLTGALQEAIARIETLEAEVATLKGN